MLLEAVYHRPKLNWAYAYDGRSLHIRVRTKRDNVKEVNALVGDKYAWEATKETVCARKLTSDALFDYWETTVIPPFRRVRYSFELISDEHRIWLTEKGFTRKAPTDPLDFFDFPFINPADVFAPPEWVKDAVFYQIFPERFANGDPDNDPDGTAPWGGTPSRQNFFGGDLQGVIDHLDYLSDLGINAIYFNPIFEATANHKYDTRDYLKVDPQFGTNETLKQLVTACHQRGIRVLLDAVFNHCGHTFPPFVDVLEKGEASPYAGWFHVREWPLRVVDGIPTYDTFGFEPIMPKLNTEHPDVKNYLLNVARYWIEEVGIDGYRLDVANEVDHRFWRQFRDVVKTGNPDAYILGEIWHDSLMWLQGDQFDAVMNYPFTDSVLDFFIKETLDAAGFANAIGTQIAGLPRQVTETSFNLLSSHDTPRLLTLCEGDNRLMKLAVLFQFTYPGTPCIYYGDEIGMEGEDDPDCRKCMVWEESDQDHDLLAFFRSLISLRKNNSALRKGNLRFLCADAGDRRIAYERSDESDHFIVLINAYARSRSCTADLPQEEWTNAFTGETVRARKGKWKGTLPTYGYLVLHAVNE